MGYLFVFIFGILFHAAILPIVDNIAEYVAIWIEAITGKWAIKTSENNLKVAEYNARINEVVERAQKLSDTQAIGFEYIADQMSLDNDDAN